MIIPDSLQTLGDDVFMNCLELAPSHIDVYDYYIDSESDEEDDPKHDVSWEIVAHLHSLRCSQQDAEIKALKAMCSQQDAEIKALKAMCSQQGAEIKALKARLPK